MGQLSKSILIVDDEIGILDALDAALVDEGYRTFTAVNGRIALDILEKHAIDLVLLDYMMPILDGKKTLIILRQNKPELPVILLSAINEPSLQKEGVIGYNAYFRKPFDLIELLGEIVRLLSA